MVPRPGQPERYFAALRTEVEQHLDDAAGPFTCLYVGGGTPTLFPDLLRDVVGLLPATGERAIEVLPTHGTPARLDALADMGFTAVVSSPSTLAYRPSRSPFPQVPWRS